MINPRTPLTRKEQKTVPLRRCAGCGKKKEKSELLRLYQKGTKLLYDPGNQAEGRGYYVCPNKKCFTKAIKRLTKRMRINKKDMIKTVVEAFASSYTSLQYKPLRIKSIPSTYNELWNIVKNMI